MKKRREFLVLGSSALLGLAAEKTMASTVGKVQHECEEIDYPKKGYTMKFDDMTGISGYEAKRMGLQVYECQREIAAKEMLNHLYRLKKIQSKKMNLFEHAILAASLAREEMKGKKNDDDYVVVSLLFNVGKVLSPQNPHKLLAAILKPYIEELLCLALENYQMYKKNPVFYYQFKWGPTAFLLDKWQEEAYSTTIIPTKFSKLRSKVKSFFWADVIFKNIPHEKVIPD